MNTYTKLTAYLPILEADNFGKWIVDSKSKGTIESPIQMPYVTYSRMARHFIDDVYTFADEHQEYGLYSYNDILFENGIERSIVSMSEVDTSTLDGKCITALLMGAIRADKFSEGALLWLPSLFRSIVNKAKEFLQNLIRQTELPPKPVLNLDMAEFRTMQKLMIQVQDRAKEIRSLQEEVPRLKTQLAETKGIFKSRERKELETKIRRTEEKISAMLEELPEILKEDGYPDVRAFMATYRKAEAVVEQYNRDLAEWECTVREKRRPAEKEQAAPPRRESVLKRLRQLQAEGRTQKSKCKTHDMER